MRSYFCEIAVNIDGKPVERNKLDYPYSYSPYVVERVGDNEEYNSTVYSDRLFQWDYKKFNRISQKHFNNESQSFSKRSLEKIESFLKDYFDNPKLKLIVIQEGCNVSNGYPYWIFHFNNNKNEKK